MPSIPIDVLGCVLLNKSEAFTHLLFICLKNIGFIKRYLMLDEYSLFVNCKHDRKNDTDSSFEYEDMQLALRCWYL